MAFPTTLDDLTTNNDITDGSSYVQATDIDTLNVAVDALQTKVGIDGSAVTTSLDYLVKKQGIKQIQQTKSGAVSTATTQVPWDDTIPQNTEGDEIMTVSITPKSATNKLYIDALVYVAYNFSTGIIGAIFQDSTASALAAAGVSGSTQNAPYPMVISFDMTAGTTSSTTFKLRVGPQLSSKTITINGASGSRLFGGVFYSYIRVTEVAVP